jgi:radical SAM protein with 4Fe4S-binding SPASM domain
MNKKYITTDRVSMYTPMEDKMTVDNPFSSLMLIDLMTTELCNLRCDFCPRSKGYPNLNLHMDMQLIDKLASDLADIRYENRILYSGFGESLLYTHLIQSIKSLKTYMPWQQNIHIVTNGDRLDEDMAKTLYDSGIRKFFVSMYQGAWQAEKFSEIFDKIGLTSNNYILQHYYKPPEEEYGFLHLSNRSGYLFDQNLPQTGCNVPFYSMSIHWDGDVLLCSHDWEKKQIMGNIGDTHVKDIWLKSQKLWEFRSELMSKRQCHPCNKCNIKGILYGDQSKEILLANRPGISKNI